MRRAGLGALAGGLLLGASWMALQRPGTQRADVAVGDALREAGGPGVDAVVTATTDLGSVYAVVGMAAARRALGRERLAGDVLGSGLLAWILGQGSKTRVRRRRPYESDGTRRLVRPPTGSSFPSGHAAVATAVGVVIARSSRSRFGRGLFAALGPYVAASRVYVGVHYPTDVLGGTGIGLAVGALWRGRIARVGRRIVAGLAGVVLPG